MGFYIVICHAAPPSLVNLNLWVELRVDLIYKALIDKEAGATRDIGTAKFHVMILVSGVDVGFRAGLCKVWLKYPPPQPNLQI